MDVVRLAPPSTADEACTELAQAGGGAVYTVDDGRALWATLYSLATSASAVVAENVALAVHFDPQVVKRYRLLGHEGHAFHAARGEKAVRMDLHIGEAAAAMFELELEDAFGSEADVGTVYLEWRDPQTAQPHALSQRVAPAQFATVLAEAVLPLQRATIAALAAEVLRGVRYAPTDASLRDVLAAADSVSGQLWDEVWFVELAEAIQTAAQLSSASH
jgi:Ca-activated chloride channel family protein